MKISVFAEDLVKRCVWDHYVYYVLGSDKDAEQLLKEILRSMQKYASIKSLK